LKKGGLRVRHGWMLTKLARLLKRVFGLQTHSLCDKFVRFHWEIQAHSGPREKRRAGVYPDTAAEPFFIDAVSD